MPGPPPKNPAIRRRRNKATTATTLAAKPRRAKPPALPPCSSLDALGEPVADWHPQTKAWWADIWASPLGPEYITVDVAGLLILAVLVDAFWHSPTRELAGEIRLQRQCFGLTPIDRRRLQWKFGPDAATTARRTPPKPPATRAKKADPRRHLSAVS